MDTWNAQREAQKHVIMAQQSYSGLRDVGGPSWWMFGMVMHAHGIDLNQRPAALMTWQR